MSVAPVLVGTGTTKNPAVKLALKADHAFVATGCGGVQVFDISKPRKPNHIGEIASECFARSVAIQQNTFFVGATTSGLETFDIRNPKKLRVLDRLPLSGKLHSLALKDGRAYVARGDWGIGLFQIVVDELLCCSTAGNASKTSPTNRQTIVPSAFCRLPCWIMLPILTLLTVAAAPPKEWTLKEKKGEFLATHEELALTTRLEVVVGTPTLSSWQRERGDLWSLTYSASDAGTKYVFQALRKVLVDLSHRRVLADVPFKHQNIRGQGTLPSQPQWSWTRTNLTVMDGESGEKTTVTLPRSNGGNR